MPGKTFTIRDMLRRVGQVSGHIDKTVGGVTIPGGPIPGFLTSTGLGLGTGLAGGALYNLIRGGSDAQKSKRLGKWILLGGLLGAGTGGVASYLQGDAALSSGKPVLNPDGTQDISGEDFRPTMSKLWRYPLENKKASVLTAVLEKQAQGPIPVGQSLGFIAADPMLSPVQKALAMNVMLNANQGRNRGLVSSGDLFRGAVGAGLGYAAGAAVASVMDGMFGLPTPVKSWLSRIGAIGGALQGAGLVR